MFKLTDVGVCYRSGGWFGTRSWVLESISLELSSGETLGLIGSNGAGKSTLLRVMAGILAPDVGTVQSYGSSSALLALQAGFMPHLTGRENVFLGAALAGVSRRHVAKSMEWVVEFTDLSAHIDQPIRTYSAGMKARLGFAVASLPNPDLLLIDEVLGVGDEDFRWKSAEALKDRIRSNKTVVLVSHNAQTIAELCDRVMWLKGSRVHRLGTTNEILPEYLDFYRKMRKLDG